MKTDMKTTFTYDHYYVYEELSEKLKELSLKYPDLMDLNVNCVTEEDRNQYLVTLTNKKTGNALDKPAFYLDGNIHAGEVTASMCAMHTIDYLLSNYNDSEEIRKLLDSTTLYCIPRVTPDGAEMYLNSPYTLRSVDRVNKDEKGGIREKDLDEDGVIRMMRIKTPYGAWKKDKEDPSLMVLRQPSDDEGEFYDIYPEGILEEYGGNENLKTARDKWGLDFNRNFPYGWFPEPRQEGAGVYPLSNTETKAVADFVLAHPNICGAALGHTCGGLILYVPGTKPSDQISSDDMKVIKAIAHMGEEELGYKPINIFDTYVNSKEFYDSGALDDWLFETQGIIAYTMEFWDIASKAGMPYEWEKKQEEMSDQIKRFALIQKWIRENAPQYYCDWKKIDHPDFGEVEIGGFNYKFTYQNPPENMLLNELEADTRFNIRFMKSLPKLVLEDLRSEKIADGIYRIETIIGNTGYLSTALSDIAVNNHYAKPVIVTVKGGELIEGKEKTEISELQGYSKTQTGFYHYGNISTDQNALQRKKLSWIIKAEEGTEITVEASQVKAGKVSAGIRL
jgi:hypothetical protein